MFELESALALNTRGIALTSGGAMPPERVREVAREFEAVFIHEVLRQMREASRWLGDDDDPVFGARLMETIDGELARHLAASGGLGLAAMLRPLTEPASGSSPSLPGPAPIDDGRRPSSATEPPTSDRTAPITSGFGFRHDPIAANRRFHAGIDIRAAYGREIGAAGSGRVVFAGDQGSYGMSVIIEHGGGLRTRYAHLSSIAVEPGDSVAGEQLIGRAGDTGRATGSHLHFELLRHGKAVDPSTIDGGLDDLLKKLRLSADWSDDRTEIGLRHRS